MFQLGRDDQVYVGFTWKAFLSDGVQKVGDTCQILVRFTGPAELPSYRDDNCSRKNVAFFSGNPSYASVAVTGDYTITVLDGMSGIESSATFRVVP
ncbi:hypothetical protein ACFDTO_28990 [Microbacteriaceae bacterium 4G12]